MCIGNPVRIVTCDLYRATALDGDRVVEVDLALVGPQAPGTWVLDYLGAAREVLAEDEALKIRAALEGLRNVMRGGDFGDAFADLEARPPQLPPHLQAALDAGKSTA
jgi:hydrogenase expression/formation protein HypC